MPPKLYPSSRRAFLKQSAIAAGALFSGPQILTSQALGNSGKRAANSRMGMGFIGLGLVSHSHLATFSGMSEVQPIAVCEVKEWQLDQAVNSLRERGFT